MYLLRVSQKLLFICNLCWVASVIFRVISLDHWPDVVVKSIVVLGLVVALPLGIILNLLIIGLWLSREIKIAQLSGILFACNLVFIPVIIIFRIF